MNSSSSKAKNIETSRLKVSKPVKLKEAKDTAAVNLSSPLSSPDHSAKLDQGRLKHNDVKPQLAQNASDATTEDEGELPSMADAKSVADALRIVVMTRLRCDRQTRDERVNPVLGSNLALAERQDVLKVSTSAEQVIQDVTKGGKMDSKMKAFAKNRVALGMLFTKRADAVSQKTQRLREEYLELHERWQAHCAKLDNKSTKKPTKEIPVVTEEPAVATSTGRSTRRTAAMLGDAVRSDLEMEQIIASLGVEELTDPNHLALRNLAKIPDMISVVEGEVKYLYDDTNNIVDDPIHFYDSSVGLDAWTAEEKEIFLEQFAANPKQFGIIASFLPSKTAAQCVTYYYLTKKRNIDFRKVVSLYAPGKRKRGGRRTDKQKGNALMADIRQHDDEVSMSHSGPTTRRKRVRLASDKTSLSRLGASRLELTPTSTPTPDPEPEVKKRGRRPRVVSLMVEEEDDEIVSLVNSRNYCVLIYIMSDIRKTKERTKAWAQT